MKVNARTRLCSQEAMHQETKRKTRSLKQQRRLSHSQKSRFLNNGSSDFSFFFCCNFTHLVAFLGHYCKTLPEVSNICYSYAWGIRLNMSYGKKSAAVLDTTVCHYTRERKGVLRGQGFTFLSIKCKCTVREPVWLK